MPTLDNADAELSQLVGLTGIRREEIDDFFTCTSEQRALILEGYKKMAWTRDPSTLAEVLRVAGVVAQIAGDVTGVIDGAEALNSLRSL